MMILIILLEYSAKSSIAKDERLIGDKVPLTAVVGVVIYTHRKRRI